MKVVFSHPFTRDFQRLPKRYQRQFDKALRLFLSNFHHPSLETAKLGGRCDEAGREIWYARVSQSHRFNFVMAGDDCILRRIGKHDILKTP